MNIDDLRLAMEQTWQVLCGESQRGGGPTFDELIEVLEHVMDVARCVDELMKLEIRRQK